MPELVAPAAPLAPVVVAAPPALLAGKFTDEAALSKGINEARKATGRTPFPESVKMIGDGGLFATAKEAEDEYAGYQKQISQPKPGAAPAAPAGPVSLPELGKPLPDDAAPAQVLERAGLKQEDLLKQWTEKGSLTDEQYTKIKDADPRLSRLNSEHAKTIVNQELKLADATHKLEQIEVKAALDAAHAIVGGKDKFDALLTEAPKFVPAAELEGMKLLVGNAKTLPMATRLLQQMHATHVGAGGSAPVVAGSPGSGSPQIKTVSEYKALEKRVMANDPAAIAIMNGLDQKALHSLATK